MSYCVSAVSQCSKFQWEAISMLRHVVLCQCCKLVHVVSFNGKPFQCYGMSYCVSAVGQCSKFKWKPFQCYGMSYCVSAVGQCSKFKWKPFQCCCMSHCVSAVNVSLIRSPLYLYFRIPDDDAYCSNASDWSSHT
jgi:hypothetical protein